MMEPGRAPRVNCSPPRVFVPSSRQALFVAGCSNMRSEHAKSDAHRQIEGGPPLFLASNLLRKLVSPLSRTAHLLYAPSLRTISLAVSCASIYGFGMM
jgi:hypothetical protein